MIIEFSVFSVSVLLNLFWLKKKSFILKIPFMYMCMLFYSLILMCFKSFMCMFWSRSVKARFRLQRKFLTFFCNFQIDEDDIEDQGDKKWSFLSPG